MDESRQPAAPAQRDHCALFTEAVVYFQYVFSITPANINHIAEKLLKSGLAETVSSPKDGEVRISNRFAPINTDIQHIIFDYYLYNSGASKIWVARQYPWKTVYSLTRRLIKSVSSALNSIFGPSRRETAERIAHQETGDDETTAYDRLRESIAQLQVIPAIQHTIETDLYQPGYLQGEPYLRLSLRAAHIELGRKGQQPLGIASEIQLLIHRSGVVQLLLPCRLPDPIDTDDLISHMTSTGVRIASVEVAEEVANLYALSQRSKVNQLSGVLRDELSEGTRWRRFEMDGDELTNVFDLYQGAILQALGAELTGNLWYCYSSTFVTPTCCDSEADWMSAHTAELRGILTRHRSYRNYRRVLDSYCNHVSAAERLERTLAAARRGERSPRSRPKPAPAAKQRTVEQIEEMVGLWHQCGNVAEIGRIVGAHESTVRRGLRKAGIDTSPRILEIGDIQRIGELNTQGLAIREIEKIVGWTHGSVVKGIKLYKQLSMHSDQPNLSPEPHNQTSN